MAEIDEAIARLREQADHLSRVRKTMYWEDEARLFAADLALLLSHVEAMRWRPIEEKGDASSS